MPYSIVISQCDVLVEIQTRTRTETQTGTQIGTQTISLSFSLKLKLNSVVVSSLSFFGSFWPHFFWITSSY